MVDGGELDPVVADAWGYEPHFVPTITEIVNAGLAEKNKTASAASSEMGMSKQWLTDLANGDVQQFPKTVDSIRVLARYFGITEATIVLGYARSLGLNIPTSLSALAQRLPPEAYRLTETQVHAVRLMIKAMVEPDLASRWDVQSERDERLAAKRGTSKGQALRAKQDADAEDQQ